MEGLGVVLADVIHDALGGVVFDGEPEVRAATGRIAIDRDVLGFADLAGVPSHAWPGPTCLRQRSRRPVRSTIRWGDPRCRVAFEATQGDRDRLDRVP